MVRISRTKTGKPVKFFKRDTKGDIKRDIKRNCGAGTNDDNIFFAFLYSPAGGGEKQKGRVRKPDG